MSKALMTAASLYDDQRFLSRSEIRIYKNRIRRHRIVRCQRIALAMIIAIIVFLFMFLASTIVLEAEADTFVPEYKYYKTVTVHAGDTLWNIATDNFSEEHYEDINSYMDEICSINNILGDEINAGEDIVVPYFSTEFK